MYSLNSDDPDHWAAKSLLMMPCTQAHRGEPLERIVLTRDELANLAWAVQHHITDDRGERVDCRDIWFRMHEPAAPEHHRVPAYRVQTQVPDYWFPLVPVAEKPGVIHFSLADINAPEATAAQQGRLVNPNLWLHEEEVPREGAVRAAPTDAGALVRRVVAQLGAPGEIGGHRGKFERTGLRQRLAHGSVAGVTGRLQARRYG